MITKFIIILISIPVKTLKLLFVPKYFYTATRNLGKILITDDNVFSTDGYSKPNRRVVVTSDDNKNIKVNKIKSDLDYDPNATTASRNKQKRFTTKIDYNKYSPLTKESVVEYKQYDRNELTGNKLNINDSHFTDTGVRLSNTDLRKINRNIKK